MADSTVPKSDSMFSDTQKGLAWFICGSFVLLIFVWVMFPPRMAPESMAQLNNLVSTLVNIVLLAIGYFFGSSRSSKDKDDNQAKVTEKLTDKVIGTGGDMQAAATAAAALAAPGAAAVAAPPVVNEVVPPAVKTAVTEAFAEQDKAKEIP